PRPPKELAERPARGEPASDGRLGIPLFVQPGDERPQRPGGPVPWLDGGLLELKAQKPEGLGQVLAVRLDRLGGRILLQPQVGEEVGQPLFECHGAASGVVRSLRERSYDIRSRSERTTEIKTAPAPRRPGRRGR